MLREVESERVYISRFALVATAEHGRYRKLIPLWFDDALNSTRRTAYILVPRRRAANGKDAPTILRDLFRSKTRR